MGYILDECPQVQACCWCVPLRAGAGAAGLAGLAWAALLLAAFAPGPLAGCPWAWAGAGSLKAARYFNGASGVLLAAAHLLLVCAALHESDSFCEVYIWFMACFWLMTAAFGAAVCLLAALQRDYAGASYVLAYIIISILISFYLVLVVANFRMTLP